MRTSQSKGHSQPYDSSAPFEPEVRNRTPRTAVRASGSGHWFAHVQSLAITSHSQLETLAPTSPVVKSPAAHRNAYVKFSNCNCQYGMPKIPATIGTDARSGPEK